ncbi:MAG: branched-chain amino acid ABC transporter permease [Candidatus Dormibacteraeota bacterium]|nr:branched-chain amino acid ABC transporter permease [Candidatus Dormibacteraeota bacterium]
MSLFVQYLVAGLADGCAFALVATGFVAIYRVTQVVNFAQGAFAVVAGMSCYSLLQAGVPHPLAELAAVGVGALLGVAVGAVAIGRRGTPVIASLVITLGAGIFCYAVEIVIWGDQPLTFNGLKGAWEAGGVQVFRQYALVVVVTLLAFAALALFFGRTYIGKAMSACASNPYAARLAGIPVMRMGLVAFALGGALGGLAGVLLTPLRPVAFDSDVAIAVSGFAAAVFGGLTRPWTALGGGLVLGVVQAMVAGYGQPAYQSGIALTLILVLLVYRALRHPEIT